MEQTRTMRKTFDKNDKLLNLYEVCSMTTLSKSEMYREIQRGHLRAHRLGNKRIVIRRSDVLRYLAARMRPISS